MCRYCDWCLFLYTGTAEWAEFVALFFNREEAAANIVDNIADRYECASEKASDAMTALETAGKPSNQTVLWVSFWSEKWGWYLSACGDWGTDRTRSAWYCEMLEQVGGVSLDYSVLEKPGASLTMQEVASLDLASVDIVIWAMDDLNEVSVCID
jgi:ABC-type Fe3+-hydroxamate transport system substrate-binding protein